MTRCLVQLGMPEIFKAGGSKKGTNEMEKILEKCPRSQWGSFMAGSDELKFESQQEDEKVGIFGGRHPLTKLGWITIISFALFIPFFWNEFSFILMLNWNNFVNV